MSNIQTAIFGGKTLVVKDFPYDDTSLPANIMEDGTRRTNSSGLLVYVEEEICILWLKKFRIGRILVITTQHKPNETKKLLDSTDMTVCLTFLRTVINEHFQKGFGLRPIISWAVGPTVICVFIKK